MTIATRTAIVCVLEPPATGRDVLSGPATGNELCAPATSTGPGDGGLANAIGVSTAALVEAAAATPDGTGCACELGPAGGGVDT